MDIIESECTLSSPLFSKMVHSRALLFNFVFLIQLTVNICSYLKFANDWIRTADVWNWKRPLCQLSHHHHCPSSPFLKWANPGLFLVYFRPSTLHNLINWWKRTWHARDSNQGQQNGRRRRIHRAMAVPQAVHYYLITFGFVPSFEALTHQMQSINYNVQFV